MPDRKDMRKHFDLLKRTTHRRMKLLQQNEEWSLWNNAWLQTTYIRVPSSMKQSIYLRRWVYGSAQRLGETLNNLCSSPLGTAPSLFPVSQWSPCGFPFSELLFACSYSHFYLGKKCLFREFWLAHFTLEWEELFAGQPTDCCLWIPQAPVTQSATFEPGSSGVKHGDAEGEQLSSERDCGHEWQVIAHDNCYRVRELASFLISDWKGKQKPEKYSVLLGQI